MNSTVTRSALVVAALLTAPLAHAVEVRYFALLTGAAENPDVVTTGSGSVDVTYDDATHLMRVRSVFSGLLGNTTVAHIHCCQADPSLNVGVATTTPTFTGFPAGVTAGTFDQTYDMSLASSYNPAFITNTPGATVALAEARLFTGMANGGAYFNIHSSLFGGGEIRGTLKVPEPSALALVALSLVGVGVVSRRRPS